MKRIFSIVMSLLFFCTVFTGKPSDADCGRKELLFDVPNAYFLIWDQAKNCASLCGYQDLSFFNHWIGPVEGNSVTGVYAFSVAGDYFYVRNFGGGIQILSAAHDDVYWTPTSFFRVSSDLMIAALPKNAMHKEDIAWWSEVKEINQRRAEIDLTPWLSSFLDRFGFNINKTHCLVGLEYLLAKEWVGRSFYIAARAASVPADASPASSSLSRLSASNKLSGLSTPSTVVSGSTATLPSPLELGDFDSELADLGPADGNAEGGDRASLDPDKMGGSGRSSPSGYAADADGDDGDSA